MAINLELEANTEKKVILLLNNSENKNLLFEEFIEYQINEIKKSIRNIKKDLTVFEKKYNMTSDELYHKEKSGESNDCEDFIIWSGIYKMYLNNIDKLKKFE